MAKRRNFSPDFKTSVYLENKRSCVVRRCVQRFAAGESSARDSIERIRQHADVRDDDFFQVRLSDFFNTARVQYPCRSTTAPPVA